MARLATLSLQVSGDDRLDELRIKLQEACSNGRIYGMLGMEDIRSEQDGNGELEEDDADDDSKFPPDDDPDLSGVDAPEGGADA